MSLLSGHHRIMEAAEAALVMMVLEEGGPSGPVIGIASWVESVSSWQWFELKAGDEEERKTKSRAKRLHLEHD
jgi:hypothetical protein